MICVRARVQARARVDNGTVRVAGAGLQMNLKWPLNGTRDKHVVNYGEPRKKCWVELSPLGCGGEALGDCIVYKNAR